MAFRLIPNLDGNAKIVDQAQSAAGKLSLLFLFTLPLLLLNQYWRQTLVVLLITTYLPQFRRATIAVAAAVLAIAYPDWLPLDSLARIATREGVHIPYSVTILAGAAVAMTLLLLTISCAIVFRWPKARWLKRPLVLWHATFGGLVVAAALLPFSGLARVWAWAFVFALSGYFWYFCYTIVDRSAAGRDGALLQEGTWRPAWTVGSGTSTPFVKGAAYLRQIEAKTPYDLAVTQIKGLKLAWWCVVLRLLLAGIEAGLHGSSAPVAVPIYPQVFEASVAGHPFPVYLCWASLISEFVENVLRMCVWGNQIVACCRMAGFRAPRNTWRPFEARTIAEFWNRYYFYFKELLVDLFFYPTFLRYFKGRPRLRKFVATFMAAAVGNMLFHFFRDVFYCAEMGIGPALAGYRVYAFYCVILGSAIGVSQLRADRARTRTPQTAGGSWLRRRLWPGVCVGGFYCLMQVFDDSTRTTSLSQHFQVAAELLPFGRYYIK